MKLFVKWTLQASIAVKLLNPDFYGSNLIS